MTAREIQSPWSTTDTIAAKRDRGDFSVYPIPADQPVPADPKVSPAQESADSSVSPTPSAVTSANPVPAEKAPSLSPPLTVMPPL